MPDFRLICCVVRDGEASKVLKAAKSCGVSGGTITLGRWIRSSRLLTALGLNEDTREIVTMVVERELSGMVMKAVRDGMRIGPHRGIAFSMAISEFTGHRNNVDNIVGNKGRGSAVMYNIIYTVVDKGKGESVIDAAHEAGAKGGTIINARGAGVHEVQRLFSMEIEPEKEEVFIISKTEAKDGIVASIRANLGIDEPGNGIMFVMDVNEAYGLL